MIRRTSDGTAFYQFLSLAQHAEVLHGVFTRLGGRSQGAFSSLNVGHLVGDDPAVVQVNHELICRTLGIVPEQTVTAYQVHGAHVAVVDASHKGTIVPSTDALVTNQRGLTLLLRFADCVPLMLYDAQRHAIGLVHAGWRGLVAGVVVNAVVALQTAFGCHTEDLFAALGPAIGPCCYQVGADVVAEVERAFGTRTGLLFKGKNGLVHRPASAGNAHFDLPAAVRQQLAQLGVRNIEDSGLCTACRTDEFFSHRAEKGHTGRFAVIMALR